MKNSNVKPLKPCPMCRGKDIRAMYLESRQYNYECAACGQWFAFNAPSQLAADVIWNQVIARGRE